MHAAQREAHAREGCPYPMSLRQEESLTTEKEPPEHLGKSGRALWCSITAAFGMRADSLAVLVRACETADTIDAMNAALVGQPLVVPGSQGQLREHPLLSEKRQQVALQARLLAQLKLPDPDSGGRRRRRPAVASRVPGMVGGAADGVATVG
jgi:hypothetical protein